MLFTDLVGSTEQRTRLGDDAADVLRQVHDRLVGAAVAASSGEVVKSTGDGLLAVFGSAADALDAAVAAQQAISARNAMAEESIGVRAGLGIGDVSVESTGDVFGTPVVEASRLCDAADEGGILCTDFVRHMAGTRGGHEFDSVGALDLKGLAGPTSALRVRWNVIDRSMPIPPMLTRSQTFGFVGRDDELLLLTEAWKRSLVEGPIGVLVSGEPGAGKTRLSSQFAAQRHADGVVVLAGRCDEHLGVPFQPFVEALRYWLVNTPEAERAAGLGATGGELIRLIPELLTLAPGIVEPSPADPDTERYRLFEAVGTWLSSIARSAPVVLVLDDIHWAAAPTLQLLSHLLRGDDEGPIMFVGTYRDTDLDRSHPLSNVLADLRRADGTERIALKGLDLAGVEHLLTVASGHDLDASGRELAAAIHAETDGNAFFAESMIRHLAETGGVEHRDGRWVLTRPIDALGLPEGIREVVGRRLGRLSDQADEVLHVAAVIGAEFNLDVLEAVSGRSDDEVDAVVAEAAAAGLLEEADATTGRFSHTLVRASLLEEVSTRKQLRLHAAIVEAIEHIHAGHLDRHLTQLARHSTEAAATGDLDKAVHYNQLAASQAAESAAWADAVGHLRQAVDLLEEEGAVGGEVYAELLTRLGEALGHVQDPSADDVTLEAARIARAAGRGDLVVESAIAFGRELPSRNIEAPATLQAQMGLLEEALEAIAPEDSYERALLLLNLAGTRQSEGWEQRRDLVDDAVEMARRCCSRRQLIRIIAQASWHLNGSGRDRLALPTEAVELFDGLDRRERSSSWAHFALANAQLMSGDLVGAEKSVKHQAELVAQVSGPLYQAWQALAEIDLATAQGEFERGERLMSEHFDGLAGISSRPIVLQSTWFLRFQQGRAADLPTFVAQSRRVGADDRRSSAPHFALSALEYGDEVAARRIIEPYLDLPFDGPVAGAATWIVPELIARFGDVEAAARYQPRDRLGPWTWNSPVSTAGSWERYDGLIATCLGHWDQAEAHFAEAERQHDEQGALTFLHRGRLDWAWMLQRRGDPSDRDRARQLAQMARVGAAEVGMPLVERRAAALEAELI